MNFDPDGGGGADEYESLPQNTTHVAHMLAGALAGMTEHSVMYPVDVIKTRVQCAVPGTPNNNLLKNIRNLISSEGFRSLRGVSAVLASAGPAHAAYFSSYEAMKNYMNADHKKFDLKGNLATGLVATLVHDAVMNPGEVIKQRMQLQSPYYTGCLQCMTRTFQSEGLIAFYRSYFTQTLMNIPFQLTHITMYEFCQDLLNESRQYNAMSHIISGGVAGGLAAFVTTPLDVHEPFWIVINLGAGSFVAGLLVCYFRRLLPP